MATFVNVLKRSSGLAEAFVVFSRVAKVALRLAFILFRAVSIVQCSVFFIQNIAWSAQHAK